MSSSARSYQPLGADTVQQVMSLSDAVRINSTFKNKIPIYNHNNLRIFVEAVVDYAVGMGAMHLLEDEFKLCPREHINSSQKQNALAKFMNPKRGIETITPKRRNGGIRNPKRGTDGVYLREFNERNSTKETVSSEFFSNHGNTENTNGVTNLQESDSEWEDIGQINEMLEAIQRLTMTETSESSDEKKADQPEKNDSSGEGEKMGINNQNERYFQELSNIAHGLLMKQKRELEKKSSQITEEMREWEENDMSSSQMGNSFRGFAGRDVSESLIGQAMGRHCKFYDVKKDRFETVTETHIRMVFWHNLMESLPDHKHITKYVYVGDVQEVLHKICQTGHKSRAKQILEEKRSLANLKKESSIPLETFLLQLRTCFDNLDTLGAHISQSEQISTLLLAMEADVRYNDVIKDILKDADRYDQPVSWDVCIDEFSIKARELYDSIDNQHSQEMNVVETDKKKKIDTNRKTHKLCRNFVKFGKCSFGDKCIFVHVTVEDLKKVKEGQNGDVEKGANMPNKKGQGNVNIKKSLCFQWEQKGTCSHGNDCKFEHAAAQEACMFEVSHQ